MQDLTGQKFGRLTVLKREDYSFVRYCVWLCLCECGNKKRIRGYSLKSGNTKSCGCLRKEKSTKHGHGKKGYRTKTYESWANMMQRCINPNNKGYINYGKRGITICKRWVKFENFLEDMGEVPKGCQIDRIDNNGNYYKSNCRWVTPKKNNRNKRSNHFLTHDGKTQCIVAWAEQLSIGYATLWSRIYVYGWSIGKALTTPVKERKK